MLVFILVGGIVADRVNQRAIIIAVETANVAATGAVAILGTLGALQLWHMAVASAVLGVGAAFFFPAYSAYLPRILPPEQLLAANGVEGAIRPTLQQAIGPAVAGIVVGATLPSLGAVTVAALFATGLVLLVSMRPSEGDHIVMAVERENPHPLTRFTRRAAVRPAHRVAALDAAVRQHVGLPGPGSHRRAAAVHRPRALRSRRAGLRLHAGGLRVRQRTRCAGGLAAADRPAPRVAEQAP